jgi:glycerol-3-phosphate dehydrogenase
MPRANVSAAILEKFSRDARRSGLSEEQIQRLIHRYGGDVGRFDVEQLASLGGDTRVGEVTLALNLEQAETVEDVMRRRLNLEYLPGHGLEALPQLVQIMTKLRPGRTFVEEATRYRERLTQLRALMGLPSLTEAPRMAATS